MKWVRRRRSIFLWFLNFHSTRDEICKSKKAAEKAMEEGIQALKDYRKKVREMK